MYLEDSSSSLIILRSRLNDEMIQARGIVDYFHFCPFPAQLQAIASPGFHPRGLREYSVLGSSSAGVGPPKMPSLIFFDCLWLLLVHTPPSSTNILSQPLTLSDRRPRAYEVENLSLRWKEERDKGGNTDDTSASSSHSPLYP